MKSLCAALLAALVAAEGRGGPTERAVLAAMSLSEQPNYSWVSTVVDDVRTYQIEGKTQRGGCTWIRMPMVVAMARRLGRRADAELQGFFRGNETCVVLTSRGWQTLGELPRRDREWSDEDEWRFASRCSGAARWSLAGNASNDPADPFVQLQQALLPESDDTPYCNAQFGVSHPHEELGIIVSCHVGLRADGDVVTGTVSNLGAQLLLVRDGQEEINPLGAAGSFQLQIRNGRVVRYALRLAGILEVNGRRVCVRQVANTVLKDIGTTRFEVPEEARRKLQLE